MYPPEQLNIDTPENVQFAYEIAGIGSRFLAALVDTILILLLQLLVFMPLLALLGPLDAVGEVGTNVVLGTAVFISFVLLWGYYIFFEALWNGQTPGKRWVGLRVLQLSGLPLTFSEVVIRNLVRIVDFLPVAYGVGIIAMFFQAQSRRLGDLAAGTLVVFERTALSLEQLGETTPTTPTLDTAVLQFPEVAQWPLERLTEQELTTIESYLRRAATFRHNRLALAQQMLDMVFARLEEIEPPRLTSIDDGERLLREIVLVARGHTIQTG